jgi:hypothetical protein
VTGVAGLKEPKKDFEIGESFSSKPGLANREQVLSRKSYDAEFACLY